MLHAASSQPSAEELLTRAAAIAARAEALQPFTRPIAELMDMRGQAAARVGVVGLSGSGKSSLLNALMGEPLLPEETCATSQMLVTCRWGEVRRLVVRLFDGGMRVHEGEALTPDRVAAYCAARLNPGNGLGVAALEWTSPDAALPAGVALVEASGLDGMAAGEEAAIRRFLPACDAVLFVASIRQPLKPAEIRLIDDMVAYDQPARFVLTQADLERDTYQGGKLWRSRADKLQRHRRRLERQLAADTALVAPGTAVVSAKLALAGFQDRNGGPWEASGIAAILASLSEFAAQPLEDRSEQRDRRALLALDRLLLAMRDRVAAESEIAAELARLAFMVTTWLRGVPLEMTPRREQAALALMPLVAVFRELGFQRAFSELLRRLEAPSPRVLLLGAQRDNHVRLAALLGHDLALMDELEEVPADTWILAGALDDFVPPGPAIRLPVPETVLARHAIAIAPADHHLPALDWQALLAAFGAVGVEVDLARPSIGRADAGRAPYHDAIAMAPARPFYTCGNGALFADRLLELARSAAAVAPLGGLPWFVYEDYDARHTAFLRLLSAGVTSPRDFLRRWRQEGLPLDEPFSEAQLHHVASTLTQPTRGIS